MSLTDDWKNEKLQGFYWCKVNVENKENIMPVFLIKDMKPFEEKDIKSLDIVEVLAPCDYNELQWLKEELKSKDQTAAKAAEIAQLASDENLELRQLLSECKKLLTPDIESDMVLTTKSQEILTRIDKVLAR